MSQGGSSVYTAARQFNGHRVLRKIIESDRSFSSKADARFHEGGQSGSDGGDTGGGCSRRLILS